MQLLTCRFEASNLWIFKALCVLFYLFELFSFVCGLLKEEKRKERKEEEEKKRKEQNSRQLVLMFKSCASCTTFDRSGNKTPHFHQNKFALAQQNKNTYTLMYCTVFEQLYS